MDFSSLSDSDLYKKCLELGGMALKYRRQFCGMLPEVAHRRLYEKHGMHSVYEFAAKLAGISYEMVNEILRLHRLLEDKPLLQEKLVSGQIGYTKLRAIATVATPETQKGWLLKVETMPKPALETYVHEFKKMQLVAKNPTDLADTGLPGKAPVDLPAFETLSMTVRSRTAAHIRVYKRRLEKRLRKVLNWDEVLRNLLKETGRNSNQPIRLNSKIPPKNFPQDKVKPASRYIPAAIRHKLEEKYEGICTFPFCNKPAEIIHHTERFSLTKGHDLETLAPLCISHERIAHCGLIKNEEGNPETWGVLAEAVKTAPKYAVDKIAQSFRKPP